MFTIHIMGGLGNQLFQIFTALAYSIQHDNKILVFPYSEHLGKENNGTTIRITYWDNLFRNLKKFTTFPNPENNIFLNSLITFQEQGFSYTPIPPVHNQDFRLFGYFQSYKYFESQMDQIVNEKILLGPIREEVFNEHFAKYEKNDNRVSICMHFRLGDYKFKQDYHPVCPLSYYQNSLMHITQTLSTPSSSSEFQERTPPSASSFTRTTSHPSETQWFSKTLEKNVVEDEIFRIKGEGVSRNPLGKNEKFRVFYFCEPEDNEYVLNERIRPLQEFFTHYKGMNIEFVKVPDSLPDWKQLLFMTCCEHFIIANSSFSWWGAYLGEYFHLKKNCEGPVQMIPASPPSFIRTDMSPSDTLRFSQQCIVTYPSRWFGPNLAYNLTHDLCPPHWRVMNS